MNVAARLEALAEPGGISLSGKFHEEICRKLDMTFTSTGEQEMKNIHNPVPTYKIEISEFSKNQKFQRILIFRLYRNFRLSEFSSSFRLFRIF